MPWIDRAIKLVAPHSGQITLRGDTDFSLTGELDRWDEQGVKFIFGMDAHPKVVNLAEALPQEAWKPLERLPPMKLPRLRDASPSESRPGLERLRDLVSEGQVEIVLVHSPDRLSRRYAYQLLLLEEFSRQGSRFAS